MSNAIEKLMCGTIFHAVVGGRNRFGFWQDGMCHDLVLVVRVRVLQCSSDVIPASRSNRVVSAGSNFRKKFVLIFSQVAEHVQLAKNAGNAVIVMGDYNAPCRDEPERDRTNQCQILYDLGLVHVLNPTLDPNFEYVTTRHLPRSGGYLEEVMDYRTYC